MPILPDLLHGNDYILPSPGRRPGPAGQPPAQHLHLQPRPGERDHRDRRPTPWARAPSRSPPAPPSTTAAAVGRFVPPNSTVRLTSNRSFWGLAIHDHLSPANDWGYSWLATDFLTRNYTVSYAPGVSDPPGSWPHLRARPPQCTTAAGHLRLPQPLRRSSSPPSLDNTLVKVDFDNDGVFDIIDTDSRRLPRQRRRRRDTSCGTEPVTRASATASTGSTPCRPCGSSTTPTTTTPAPASRPPSPSRSPTARTPTRPPGPTPSSTPGTPSTPCPSGSSTRSWWPARPSPPPWCPTTGGQATFTITARSFSFAPLTSMTVTDLLPAGLVRARTTSPGAP